MTISQRWEALFGSLVVALLVTLVGAVIGLYSELGQFRGQMAEEHSEIRERLAALETRLDYERGPSQAGNGGE